MSVTPTRPGQYCRGCSLVNSRRMVCVSLFGTSHAVSSLLLHVRFQELKVKSTYGSSSSSNSTVNAAVQQGSKCVFPCDVSCLVPDALNLRSMMYFVPLAVLGAYFAWRYYSSGTV